VKRLLPAILICLVGMTLGRTGKTEGVGHIEPASIPSLAAEPKVIELEPAEPGGCPPVATALALSPDGRWLAVAGDDHRGQIWELEQLRLLGRLDGHTDWVRAAAFHPNGALLATGGDDHRICLWNISHDGMPRLQRRLADEGRSIRALAFSPAGDYLASAGSDSFVRLYDAAKARLLQQWDSGQRANHALVFAPHGQTLAAVGSEGKLLVWNTAGRRLLELSGPGGPLLSVAFSADGTRLAAAGSRGIVRLWKITPAHDQAQFETDLPALPGDVRALVFCSPRLLAAAGSANTIWIWDLETKRACYRLAGHQGTITRLAFDAHCRQLVSGSFDTTVRLWSWPEAQESQAARPSENSTRGRLQ